MKKPLLSLLALVSLTLSSYAHLGLSKTECDALYNQFPARSDMPNSFLYNLQGVNITILFSHDKAVAITYYAPAGLSEKFVSILAGKNGVNWDDLVTVAKGDSWLSKNKLSVKRPLMDELYDMSNKDVHVTVTEHKQWVDIVTIEGETILADLADKNAKEALKNF